jgi:hypothetical protein
MDIAQGPGGKIKYFRSFSQVLLSQKRSIGIAWLQVKNMIAPRTFIPGSSLHHGDKLPNNKSPMYTIACLKPPFKLFYVLSLADCLE